MPPEVLGGFEHQVMLSIARMGKPAYSVPIVRELERHTGCPVSPAQVYITLVRLETKGMVSSWYEPPPANEGGRDRRVFRLEPAGLGALREAKRVFASLSDGLAVLDG